VAVIDANSGGAAAETLGILAQAGFDVSPGIWEATEAPSNALTGGDAVIVFQPGEDAYAQVVSAYLPGARLLESDELRGAPVAVMVPAGYDPTPPEQGGGKPTANDCPAVAS
jgi:hypothetical protein